MYTAKSANKGCGQTHEYSFFDQRFCLLHLCIFNSVDPLAHDMEASWEKKA
jgi:hypothetical protein